MRSITPYIKLQTVVYILEISIGLLRSITVVTNLLIQA